MKNPRPIVVVGALLLGLAAYPGQSLARVVNSQPDDLAALSLEELANLEISSVSRKPESLASAAASVFVITADDIQRTGATSLPEALRLAPNLQVARSNSGNWAITARGFNTSTANKLLVLIDGRPVYTPLFSGVLWDAQDLFMADIERIEVISGPNATTWGSNAVNGVINVVTLNSEDTEGGLLVVSGGEREQVAGVRIGRRSDSGTGFRIYGKHYSTDATENEAGTELNDAFDRSQVGFRVDMPLDSGSLTIQGDAYQARPDVAGADKFEGSNLLANWQHRLDDGASVNLRGYFDNVQRDFAAGVSEDLDIVGVEFTHQFEPTADQVLVWGVDTRYAKDNVTNSATLAFLPPEKDLSWTSVFAQDDIRINNAFSLMVGARVEENSYTGTEFMPDVRIRWTPGDDYMFWGALSRSVRTPSRIDRDFYAPADPPYLLEGNNTFKSEIANVFEIGYRATLSARLSLSLTAFYADYDRLRSLEGDSTTGTFIIRNNLQGDSNGVEGWFTYEPSSDWRLSGGFLVIDKDLELAPGSTGVSSNEGNDPSVQAILRSSWDINDSTAFDVFLRHVDDLPAPAVPAYTVVDTRLSWWATHNFNVSLKVRNLFDEEHAEFDDPMDRSEFGREVSLQLRWSFL